MKKLLLLLLFPVLGFSQSSQRVGTATLPGGTAGSFAVLVPNASVSICAYNIQTQCTTPLAVYSDTGLNNVIVQPIISSTSGQYSYYVPNGTSVIEKVCSTFNQCQSRAITVGVSGITGSATINPANNQIVPIYASPSTPGNHLAPSNITVDSSGNNLTIPGLPSGNCVQTSTGGLLITTGAPCPTGTANIFGQLSGVIPLATGVAAIGAQSHLDDQVTSPGVLTASEPVSTAAILGYKQNAGNPGRPPAAIAHNRDQTTAITVTPQDFCPNSGSGPTFDDTACFNQAIRWLATQNNNSPKQLIVPWTPNGYYFSNNSYGYLYTLPYDFGDYHQSAGFVTQASASVYFTNGQLTSCSIQGGSGYAPSTELPIQILDPQHLGSGAAAYVLTDASGTPASTCVVQLAGMNYPSTGIITNVWPLGGDGATGTCSLSGGTFTSPCTVTAGGSGYNSSASFKVPANMTGLVCTTYPSLTATVTGSAVTAVTTTAGSACTFGGSGTTTVPMQFGATCGGSQCTNIAMETPVNLPLSVALLSGVSIVGVGNPVINTDYGSYIQSSTPTFNNVIAFGDPWGDQSGGIRNDLNGTELQVNRSIPPNVSNITVKAQIGFAFPLLAGGSFDHITCGAGLCFYIDNTQQSQGSVLNPFPDTRFTNLQMLNVYSGIFVGGDWKSRNPDTQANGSQGGTAFMKIGSSIDLQSFGSTGGLSIDNSTVKFAPNTVGQYATWDTWFEQYFWKAQNSPATPFTNGSHLLSNTSTTCPTLLTFVTRATDYGFGYNPASNNLAVYPWYQCYRGIGGSFVSALPRYSFSTPFLTAGTLANTDYTFHMRQVRVWGGWRPVFLGYSQKIDIGDVLTQTNSNFTDPYLPGGVPNSWIHLAANISAAPFTGQIFDSMTGTGTTGLSALNFGLPNLSALALRNIVGTVDQVRGSVMTAVLTTTSATSDTVTVTGMIAGGHCQLEPTNASAATNSTTTYVSAKTTNQITVTHTATSGMTYDVGCTAN